MQQLDINIFHCKRGCGNDRNDRTKSNNRYVANGTDFYSTVYLHRRRWEMWISCRYSRTGVIDNHVFWTKVNGGVEE